MNSGFVGLRGRIKTWLLHNVVDICCFILLPSIWISYKHRDFSIIWVFGRGRVLPPPVKVKESGIVCPRTLWTNNLGLAKCTCPPRTLNLKQVVKDEEWWEEIVLAPKSSSSGIWWQEGWWHPCQMLLSSLQIMLPKPKWVCLLAS